jgi:uncharacterized membrane protein YdjX (TVP38/TMEM64 family)
VSTKALKAILAIALIAAFVIAIRTLPVALWLEQFKSWVQGMGMLGYVLYVLVYMLCCVLLIPAFALTVGAGAIFGFVAGSIVVLIGATLGASLAFLLARTVLRRRVETFVEGHPKVAAVDRAIGREGVKLMLLCRVSGFPPFTWVNYGFGLTGVRFSQYFLTTLFGIIPGVLAFSYAGAAGAAVATGQGNRIGLIVTAIGAVLVSVYIARIALKAIRRAGVEET